MSARPVGVEAIATRDIKGFKKSDLPVYSPTETLKIIKIIEGK